MSNALREGLDTAASRNPAVIEALLMPAPT